MKTVLVTGSGGFIGQHLVRKLFELEEEVETIVGLCRSNFRQTQRQVDASGRVRHEICCNLENEAWTKYVLDEFKPDTIFHLAGNPLVKLAEDDYDGLNQFRANTLTTQHLLAHAPAGSRFVYASSATVYGDLGSDIPAPEWWTFNPTSIYAASKIAGEGLVDAFTAMGRVSGINLRYVANVGPLGTHGVLPAILEKLYSASPILHLLGEAPGSTKPFMYVGDSVAATILAGKSMAKGAFNIAPSDSITIERLAEIVMHRVGIRKPINWLGGKATWIGDNNTVYIDGSKFKDMMGWQPLNCSSEDAVITAVSLMAPLFAHRREAS